ncbi:hypothetical protein M407DRAFT_180883 [Tulasnella calospora MUT 4182]|uniref:Uncharacterized protein n=1 Tax=Tulasnella calospora MUT 4182 TaxID=1051891 RepID=A0A0C3QCI8_9AGAM|nr:hypothetical protein M407DRAFT_180883 [Tulasnella calospora MUT 4182]
MKWKELVVHSVLNMLPSLPVGVFFIMKSRMGGVSRSHPGNDAAFLKAFGASGAFFDAVHGQWTKATAHDIGLLLERDVR